MNVGQPRRSGAGEVGSGASDLPGGGHHLAHLVFQAVTSPNRGSSCRHPGPPACPRPKSRRSPEHWLLVPIFYALAFLLAYLDARVSLLMYVVLLLHFSLPGPAVVRWMTGRQAAAAARDRSLEGVA